MGVGSTIAGIAGVHVIVGLSLYSQAVGEILRDGLLALTASLVIPMPLSGGWALLPVAAWAWRRGRRPLTPSTATLRSS